MKKTKPRRRTYVSCSELDGAYDDDQVEFLRAMDRYMRDNRRPFPTFVEVLDVAKSLGYQKVAAMADPVSNEEKAKA